MSKANELAVKKLKKKHDNSLKEELSEEIPVLPLGSLLLILRFLPCPNI